MIKLEPGDIVETVFLQFNPPELEHLFREDDGNMDELINFSVDEKGRIRLGQGIVDMSGSEDLNFVPQVRWNLNPMPWNSHGTYVEIELPNPNDALYYVVRPAMIGELKRRLSVINTRLMQRQRRNPDLLEGVVA